MDKAIQSAAECHRICLETITHCMNMGGEHADPKHLQLLMDCAKICALSVDFMARGSDFHKEICRICADICEACAESCEALDGEEMQRCADACRKCAEECRAMAN